MSGVKILGLDPGSRHTGYGLIEKQGSRLTAHAQGRISCPAKLQLPDRINLLAAGLDEILREWKPHSVALEAPFHGALLAVIGQHGLAVREYSPDEVKSAVTGHGRADKQQVARMVRMILSMRDQTMTSDATDALAVAICCAQLQTFENLAAR